MVPCYLSLILPFVLAACATKGESDDRQPPNWARPWVPDLSSNDSYKDHAQVITRFNLDALDSGSDCTMQDQVAAELRWRDPVPDDPPGLYCTGDCMVLHLESVSVQDEATEIKPFPPTPWYFRLFDWLRDR